MHAYMLYITFTQSHIALHYITRYTHTHLASSFLLFFLAGWLLSAYYIQYTTDPSEILLGVSDPTEILLGVTDIVEEIFVRYRTLHGKKQSAVESDSLGNSVPPTFLHSTSSPQFCPESIVLIWRGMRICSIEWV